MRISKLCSGHNVCPLKPPTVSAEVFTQSFLSDICPLNLSMSAEGLDIAILLMSAAEMSAVSADTLDLGNL